MNVDDDPLLWLEDDGDPRTAAWVSEHNAAGRVLLDAFPDRTELAELIWPLLRRTETSVPTVRGHRMFYQERSGEAPFPRLYLRGGDPSRTPRQLVDPGEHGPADRTYIGTWGVCPAGRYLAYQICRDGDQTGVLRVLDVETGEEVGRPVHGFRQSAVGWFSTDDPHLIFSRHQDGAHGSRGLYQQNLRTGEVRLLWAPPLPEGQLFIAPALTADGRTLAISVRRGADARNGLWLTCRDDVHGSFPTPREVLAPGQAVALPRFGPDDTLYVATTVGAGRGTVCRVPAATVGPNDWVEVVPEAPDASLQGFVVTDRHVVTLRSHRARSVVTAAPLDGTESVDLPLPETAVVTALTCDPGGGNEIWLDYGDAVNPPMVHQAVEASDLWRIVRWQPPPDLPLPQVQIRHEEFVSFDGEKVGLTILSRADCSLPAPTMLHVYGGFGAIAKVTFRADTHSWVAAGGVYVYAHVRGDGDKGARWHAAGRGAGKYDTVSDVVAAAEYLVEAGWTIADRLAVFGGSNGGMVALAALVRQPNRFGACVVSAPVTDMLRFPRMGDGRAWIAEYGDPDRPEDRAILASYSPYHNVVDGVTYPPALIMSGAGDTRVPPSHARKMVARMEEAGTRPGRVLLREEANLGHGPRSARSIADVILDRHSFLAYHLGLRPSQPPGRGPAGP